MGAASAVFQCDDDEDEDFGKGLLCPVGDKPLVHQLPVTKKHLIDGRDPKSGVLWGAGCMQGWRESMEDAHLLLPSLGEAVAASSRASASKNSTSSSSSSESCPTTWGRAGVFPASTRTWNDVGLFGVMDGHGGVEVARFCEKRLPTAIAAVPATEPHRALVQAFEGMDDLLRDPASLAELHGYSDEPSGITAPLRAALTRMLGSPNFIGCTAVMCCIFRDRLVVANAGDSRAVLCRGGSAVELSRDHKPDDPEELSRIEAAGGWVEYEVWAAIHRVNGDLSLSRAIGDLEYKGRADLPPDKQVVTATPEVKTFERQPEDEFIVIACDGIWDVMSSQEVVSFIRTRLSLGAGAAASTRERLESGELRLSAIAGELMDHCLSPNLEDTNGLGGDNMTVVIVMLLPERGDPRQRPPPLVTATPRLVKCIGAAPGAPAAAHFAATPRVALHAGQAWQPDGRAFAPQATTLTLLQRTAASCVR